MTKKEKSDMIKELEEAKKGYRPQRRWTADEEEVLVAFHGKVPIAKLAEKLNRTIPSVQIHMSNMERTK